MTWKEDYTPKWAGSFPGSPCAVENADGEGQGRRGDSFSLCFHSLLGMAGRRKRTAVL